MHGLDYEFNRFILVHSSFFLFFIELNIFIFNFVLQHWINWKLSIIIYFSLFFLSLLYSHESGRRFSWLTRVYLGRYNMIPSQSSIQNFIQYVLNFEFMIKFFFFLENTLATLEYFWHSIFFFAFFLLLSDSIKKINLKK